MYSKLFCGASGFLSCPFCGFINEEAAGEIEPVVEVLDNLEKLLNISGRLHEN